METIYQWSAILGATVFLGQFALSLLSGLEADVDVDSPDVDVDSGGHAAHDFDGHSPTAEEMWFVGMLSVRAITSGCTIFGLVGLAVGDSRSPFQQALLAIAAGLGTMYAMGWLIRVMHKLESDGTVHIHDALGASGTVYLPVPEANEGTGKVTIHVSDRTMEYAAVSKFGELPLGTPVVVTAIVSEDVVEVTSADLVPSAS